MRGSRVAKIHCIHLLSDLFHSCTVLAKSLKIHVLLTISCPVSQENTYWLWLARAEVANTLRHSTTSIIFLKDLDQTQVLYNVATLLVCEQLSIKLWFLLRCP